MKTINIPHSGQSTRMFSDDQVYEILNLYSDENLSTQEISKIMDCSEKTIRNIVRGDLYKEFTS